MHFDVICVTPIIVVHSNRFSGSTSRLRALNCVHDEAVDTEIDFNARFGCDQKERRRDGEAEEGDGDYREAIQGAENGSGSCQGKPEEDTEGILIHCI